MEHPFRDAPQASLRLGWVGARDGNMGVSDDALNPTESHDAVQPMPTRVISQVRVSDPMTPDVSSEAKDFTAVITSWVELDRFMRDVRIQDIHCSFDFSK
jgi:hypothetical protein